MKKYYLLLIITLTFLQSYGQSKEKEVVETAVTIAEETKSGNYKDIFNVFYQLLANDLTNDNKTLEFNTTIFQLKTKYNSELKKDYNYEKEKFSRNLQLNFKVNFNDDFKYKGFTGGATYAIYNGRDKSVATFGKKYSYISKGYESLNSYLDVIRFSLVQKIESSGLTADEVKAKKAEITKIERQIVNGEELKSDDPAVLSDYNNELKNTKIGKFITEDEVLKGLLENEITDAGALSLAVNTALDNFYKDIEAKGLFTATINGTSNTEGRFEKADLGLVYLKGLANGKKSEFDVRGNLTYADTTHTVADSDRLNLAVKAGINLKMAKADYKSVFELKFYGEYNKIFRNALPDEDKDKILANADIRIRITDELWLPFTIKYDTKNGNFLGFLNVTYNFGDD